MSSSPIIPSADSGRESASSPATSSISSIAKPDFQGYDHVTWYVGNAKMVASYYVTRMGFKHVAYRGLETGSRNVASYVVSNAGATFVLSSPIRSFKKRETDLRETEAKVLEEIQEHISNHGDAVKDVAFAVDDVKAVHDGAVAKGAISIQEPLSIFDEHGEVTIAIIKTYGDTTHTLVDRSRYHGVFLPGYRTSNLEDPLQDYLPSIPIEVIDHCVGNQDWDGMESTCN